MCEMREWLALGQTWAFESGILRSCAALLCIQVHRCAYFGGEEESPSRTRIHLILFQIAESSDLKIPNVSLLCQ